MEDRWTEKSAFEQMNHTWRNMLQSTDDWTSEDSLSGSSASSPLDLNHCAFRVLNQAESAQVKRASAEIAAKIRRRRHARLPAYERQLPLESPLKAESISTISSLDSWSESEISVEPFEELSLETAEKLVPSRDIGATHTKRAGVNHDKRASARVSRSSHRHCPRKRASRSESPSSTEAKAVQPFKARPIPASTLIPQYSKMVARAEAKRKLRKAARRDRMEKVAVPFKGMEMRAAKQAARQKERIREAARAFAASKRADGRPSLKISPVDAAKLKEKQERDSRQRKIRRAERARKLLEAACAPVNMERASSGRAKTQEETCSFQPKVNPNVPDFDTSFARWKDKLDAARAARRRECTRPDVGDLSMFGEEAKEREAQRKAKLKLKIEAALPRRKKLVQSTRVTRPPRVTMTKSEELRLQQAMNRKKEQAQIQVRKRRALLAAAERKAAIEKTVRARVRQVERERQSTPGYVSLEEAQRKAKDKARQLKRQSSGPASPTASLSRTRNLLIDRTRNASRKAQRRQDALVRAASVIQRTAGRADGLRESEREMVDLDTEPME